MKLRLMLTLSLLLIAACEDSPLGPTDVAGVFHLVAADSLAVPYLRWNSTDTGCSGTFAGGELRIGLDGRFEMSIDPEAIICNGLRSGGSISIARGDYHVDPVLRAGGYQIQFSEEMFMGDPPYRFEGYLDGARLRVFHRDAEYIFQRDSSGE